MVSLWDTVIETSIGELVLYLGDAFQGMQKFESNRRNKYLLRYIVPDNIQENFKSLMNPIRDIIPNGPNVLIVESDDICESIKEKKWEGIFVAHGFCNQMKDNVDIAGYESLEWIIMEGNNKTDTMANLNSIKIRNNPKLKSILILDGNAQHSALFTVKDVVIKGNETVYI